MCTHRHTKTLKKKRERENKIQKHMCMCKRTEGINKKRSWRSNRSEINFRANCDGTVTEQRAVRQRRGKHQPPGVMLYHQNPPRLQTHASLAVPPAAGAGFPVPAASWSLATCCHARGLPFSFIKVTTSFPELLSPYSPLLLTLKPCWVGLPNTLRPQASSLWCKANIRGNTY